MKNALPLQLSTEAKRKAITNAIYASKGKFFTVGFIKNNGEKRLLTGRLGVKAGLKHGGKRAPTTAHLDNYIVVFEPVKGRPPEKSFRNVNLDSVYALNAFGQRIEFV